MNKDDLIAVTGSTGLVGSSIVRELKKRGFVNILEVSRSNGFNLQKQFECDHKCALYNIRPDYIFHCASMVGGIGRNIKYPADFGMTNSQINNTVIQWASYADAKMLFLGSSCIYPKDCPQPMKEEYILTGPCEPTNEMYALSKIYGIKMCQAWNKQYGTNFITCQPSNVYGENDHFDENAHVVGSLINKFHKAKTEGLEVSLWGTGIAMRELLYVDDLADACIFLMENYNGDELINVGTGKDLTIKQLSEKISNIVGYNGNVIWDSTKPNGMLRKVLDVSKINQLGWSSKTDIDVGLEKTYKWYLENVV